MTSLPLLPILLCASAALQAQGEPGAAPAVAPDRTGVAWVLPFAAAKTRAASEHRLVFVPVIAGGTNPTGCW